MPEYEQTNEITTHHSRIPQMHASISSTLLYVQYTTIVYDNYGAKYEKPKL